MLGFLFALKQTEALTHHWTMHIHFGQQGKSTPPLSNESTSIGLPLPLLGEQGVECFPLKKGLYHKRSQFHTWEDDHLLFGFAKQRVELHSDNQVAKQIYQELFSITKNHYLYRVWNYLPQINEGTGDSERYKQFCDGRSSAFRDTFGDQDHVYMPAGTCVGIPEQSFVIYFIAGKQTPDHHENPNQVPAYRYPRQYGAKSPSFARATSVLINSKQHHFISGTAAILGHESQGMNDLSHQLKITCDNLERIAEQMLNQPITAPKNPFAAFGKVYLRRATDFEEAKHTLTQRFPSIEPNLIYLHSDICRQELLVEIELTFIGKEQH